MNNNFLKSRGQEIETPENDPFIHDKLDHAILGDVLTDIVFLLLAIVITYNKSSFKR